MIGVWFIAAIAVVVIAMVGLVGLLVGAAHGHGHWTVPWFGLPKPAQRWAPCSSC